MQFILELETTCPPTYFLITSQPGFQCTGSLSKSNKLPIISLSHSETERLASRPRETCASFSLPTSWSALLLSKQATPFLSLCDHVP